MSDPSIPRRRGRPTDQVKAERHEQERLQSALRRRAERARTILARPDVQELLTMGREELGIPTPGFGNDDAGRMAWYEEATAHGIVELDRDTAAQRAVGQALQAADVEWPANWTITSVHRGRELLLYSYIHTLKLITLMDDTWHAWAAHLFLDGENFAPVTVPTDFERVPTALLTGARGQVAKVMGRPAIDIWAAPQTSRPVIYVDDDMEPEDIPGALELIRQLQDRPLYQEEATRASAPPLTEFALSLKLHLTKGNTWRSWQDTPDGQRFIVQMDLGNHDRERRHTVILGTLKPLMPGQVIEAEDGTAIGVPLRNYWPKMTR